MRNRILALTCTLAFFAPLTAFADASQPEPFLQPVSTAQSSETLVCHYYYHEGVVISRQYCMPQREWDRIRRETQQEVLDFQLRGLTQNNH